MEENNASLNPFSKYWFVAYLRTRTEKNVKKALDIENVTNYLPLMKTFKQWSDRKKKVEEPVFKNYIFVKVNDKQKMKVLSIRNVFKFVEFEGKPALISDLQMSYIRKLIEGDHDIEIRPNDLKRGDPIIVKYGPLAGLKGELLRVKGKQKVAVRLHQLEHIILIEMPLNNLTVPSNSAKSRATRF